MNTVLFPPLVSKNSTRKREKKRERRERNSRKKIPAQHPRALHAHAHTRALANFREKLSRVLKKESIIESAIS